MMSPKRSPAWPAGPPAVASMMSAPSALRRPSESASGRSTLSIFTPSQPFWPSVDRLPICTGILMVLPSGCAGWTGAGAAGVGCGCACGGGGGGGATGRGAGEAGNDRRLALDRRRQPGGMRTMSMPVSLTLTTGKVELSLVASGMGPRARAGREPMPAATMSEDMHASTCRRIRSIPPARLAPPRSHASGARPRAGERARARCLPSARTAIHLQTPTVGSAPAAARSWAPPLRRAVRS